MTGTRRRQVRTVGPRWPESRRLRGGLPARCVGRCADRSGAHERRKRAGGALHAGDRSDARRGRARTGGARRRRREHHRPGRRLAARHLRVELPRQERGRRGRTDDGPAAGARSPDPGQRCRSAGGFLEQEGILQGARLAGPLDRAARVWQHRSGSGASRPGLRDARAGVEPALRDRRRGPPGGGGNLRGGGRRLRGRARLARGRHQRAPGPR